MDFSQMDFSQYFSGDILELSKTTININKLVRFLQNNVCITKLSLMDLGIDDKDAEALATLTNLTFLNLKGNKIGAEGVKALASGNLTNLTSLNLQGNKIGAKGVKALASGNLTNLISLDLFSDDSRNLRSQKIDEVLEALIEALNDGKFPNLIHVGVDNIVSAKVAELSDALKPNKERAANDHSDSRSISNNQSEDPESESAGSKQKESDTINNVGSLMHEEKTKTQLTEERDLNQAKQYISILEDKVAQPQEKLNNIQQNLSEKISEVNTHTIKNIQLENLENTIKELDDANGKVSQLEQEVSNQQASIDDLTKERDQLASEADTLTEKLGKKLKS